MEKGGRSHCGIEIVQPGTTFHVASGYDDICIAEWLQSIIRNKFEWTS